MKHEILPGEKKLLLACASKAATRYQLHGIYFDGARLVATDSKHMAVVALPESGKLENPVILTKEAFSARILKKAEREWFDAEEIRQTETLEFIFPDFDYILQHGTPSDTDDSHLYIGHTGEVRAGCHGVGFGLPFIKDFADYFKTTKQSGLFRSKTPKTMSFWKNGRVQLAIMPLIID